MSSLIWHSIALPIVQLSLAAVLKCGQSFRWSIFPLQAGEPSTHEYRLCLRDRVICLRQTSDTLLYRSVFPEHAVNTHFNEASRNAETLSWLNEYFQLDVDLSLLYDQWSLRDPVFNSLRHRFSGIRMLKQDPWENLVSFICSANNNISRITKMVQSLCTHYSPPLLSLPDPDGAPPSPPLLPGNDTGTQRTYHPFPPPSVLAGPDVGPTLRSLGFGYRAEYIQRTAKMLVDTHASPSEPAPVDLEAPERWLLTLRDLDTVAAREELLKFVGVGRKVADCVLLMSLDKKDVVPVDTHVHQIAIEHYGLPGHRGKKANMTPQLYNQVNDRLVNVWGDYAGWAHSVLFTADLKSFASYGLPTSPSTSISAATSPSPIKKRPRAAPLASPTPPITDSQSSTSPHEGNIHKAETRETDQLLEIASLVDRVKRRRRIGPDGDP